MDVIMVVLNPSEKAIESVNSLIKYSAGMNRLILIDNASQNKTNIMKIAGLPDMHITLKTQDSLAGAWNTGLAYANTDYAVITNDDVLFTENWLPPLKEAFDSDPKLGYVQPFNTLTQVPADFPNNYRKLNKIGDVPKNNFVGCCFAVRRSMIPDVKKVDRQLWPDDWEDYGLFYTPYYPIGTEDQDALLRIKMAGYKIQTAFNSYIHHWSGETCKHIPNFEDIKNSNDELFRERWNSIPEYKDFHAGT